MIVALWTKYASSDLEREVLPQPEAEAKLEECKQDQWFVEGWIEPLGTTERMLSTFDDELSDCEIDIVSLQDYTP